MVSKAKRRRTAAGDTTAPQPRVGDVITVVSPADLSRQCVERAERNAANSAELRANAQNILAMIHDYRPKNTSSTYEPKQKEF
jgi:hypothetical protein